MYTYLFETVIILCILFIVILALYNLISGSKGTFSRFHYMVDTSRKKKLHKLRFKVPQKKDDKPKKMSSGEKECKRVLEELFGKPFTNQRPDFLRNPVTGNKFNLELDCYNEDLKLAAEYNGIQHYEFIPFFHKNKEQFYNQKYRDDIKRRMCKDNDVTLIEVPYKIKVCDIEDYLRAKVAEHGFKVKV